ncbi:F-box domain, Leucine-rich repeat domain, L domain-like protein [Artemisia annua]|uniref:F-box domain, Leucine-rich repeat domain, L domain-like protein n=1 Tax=Artemisia annua TaxID=35608 RepID=A0A2U1NJJ4_ARTAN|nr:F-box domain, Leucine-rich repeat domain, L domain-like protein [Artemisia annua]
MEENSEIIQEDATDWISELPEFIVHHILSLLKSPKELVRMSVLSKNWFALTASFPILDFDFGKLYKVIKKSKTPFDWELHTNDCLFKYIEYTTSRFCHQNVTSAHRLNLFPEILEDDTQVDIVDRCLDSVLKKGLKELNIDIELPYAEPFPNYCLPNVLLSASSLTSLKIRCCDFPPSLMVDVVEFNSLKFLQLVSVTINEKELKRSLLVALFWRKKVEKIDIQAPNLWYLDVWDLERKGAPSMNLASCKKLTSLDYYGDLSRGLADFSNNFPFLEDFFWDPIDRCNNLNLTSHSLKKFMLHGQCDLEQIDICAPNLLLFDYKGHSHNPGPLVRNAYPSKARIECYPDEAADTIWFQKFKRFLDKKSGFKELKLQVHFKTGFIDVEELKVNQSPPFKLEHVELEMIVVQELIVHLSVMDAIFFCCCPRSLTLNLQSIWPDTDFEEWSQIVKFTYEKLLQQEDQGPAIIQLALSSSSKEKKQFSDLNSLLKALPHNGPRQTIIFIKEEGERKRWQFESGKTEEDNNDITDRISELPEFIIHHILSLLYSPIERVRMSVLSKKWFTLTASLPILDLDIRKFEKVTTESYIFFDKYSEHSYDDMTIAFFKYLDYTTSRFCNQNVTSAHTFKLVTEVKFKVPQEVNIAHRCLQKILLKGVRVLVIDITNGEYAPGV